MNTNIITYPTEMVEEYYQEANTYLVVALAWSQRHRS